jgi:hypothetical protein
MKYWLSVAVAAGLVLAPIVSPAAAKKANRSHVQRTVGAYASVRTPTAVDPTGGNAAAGGNNAASMFGSNSAADNANGRTSGSGYGGN